MRLNHLRRVFLRGRGGGCKKIPDAVLSDDHAVSGHVGQDEHEVNQEGEQPVQHALQTGG